MACRLLLLLVVLQAHLQLRDRSVDRLDRFDAVAAEVMRGLLQMILRALERANGRVDLWMGLRDPNCGMRRMNRVGRRGGQRQGEEGGERCDRGPASNVVVHMASGRWGRSCVIGNDLPDFPPVTRYGVSTASTHARRPAPSHRIEKRERGAPRLPHSPLG